jgi:hypothetical protein
VIKKKHRLRITTRRNRESDLQYRGVKKGSGRDAKINQTVEKVSTVFMIGYSVAMIYVNEPSDWANIRGRGRVRIRSLNYFEL